MAEDPSPPPAHRKPGRFENPSITALVMVVAAVPILMLLVVILIVYVYYN